MHQRRAEDRDRQAFGGQLLARSLGFDLRVAVRSAGDRLRSRLIHPSLWLTVDIDRRDVDDSLHPRRVRRGEQLPRPIDRGRRVAHRAVDDVRHTVERSPELVVVADIDLRELDRQTSHASPAPPPPQASADVIGSELVQDLDDAASDEATGTRDEHRALARHWPGSRPRRTRALASSIAAGSTRR